MTRGQAREFAIYFAVLAVVTGWGILNWRLGSEFWLAVVAALLFALLFWREGGRA